MLPFSSHLVTVPFLLDPRGKKHSKRVDKAPRPSISIGVWIFSSDTFCQFNQLFSNSDAPMLSKREGEKLHMDLLYYIMSSHYSSATLIMTMPRLNCFDRWWADENIRSDFRTFRSTGTTSSPASSR